MTLLMGLVSFSVRWVCLSRFLICFGPKPGHLTSPFLGTFDYASKGSINTYKDVRMMDWTVTIYSDRDSLPNRSVLKVEHSVSPGTSWLGVCRKTRMLKFLEKTSTETFRLLLLTKVGLTWETLPVGPCYWSHQTSTSM